MAKQKEFKYGIEITRPWSVEMYRHNAEVLDEVKRLLTEYIDLFEEQYAKNNQLHLEYRSVITNEDLKLQRTFFSYGFGVGYSVSDVIDRFRKTVNELENWRANQLVAEINLPLTKQFIGFKSSY